MYLRSFRHRSRAAVKTPSGAATIEGGLPVRFVAAGHDAARVPQRGRRVSRFLTAT